MELTNSLTNKLTDIADSIREKTGKTSKLQLDEMPGEISSIVTEALLQDKTVTPSKNLQIIKADNGFDGLDEVTVNVIPSEYIVPSGTKEITENGTHDVTNYASANVNIEIGTDTTDATATASDIVSGKTAYVNGEKITGSIEEIGEEEYVELRYEQDMTRAGLDINNGYFTAIGNPLDDIFLRANSTVIVGSYASNLGDATAADVMSGKTFTSENGVKIQGTHECPKGLDTSDANATAGDILSGKTAYVNGSKVTGNISKKSAQTYTPTTANQTIASGQYLDGVQTIQGDSNLVASNIKQGVSIFGVNGNLVSYTIKTGTTTSRTINTGLSSIEQFFIYKESVTATGLIHLSYSPSGTSYMYASAWSTSSWGGTKTITNGTTAATVSGGSITLPSNTATSGGLTSNVTYKWVAIGKA